MGGRGAASGISEKGKKYGTEYHTILAVGNIKFIQRNKGSQNSPLDTMSAAENRIYVVVRLDNKLKSIVLYDKDGKRKRQIDFDHEHGRGVPHGHTGYDEPHRRDDIPLSAYEMRVVNQVQRIWKEYQNEK